MRRYAAADEEAIRTSARVGDWSEWAGLDAVSRSAIDKDLGTTLRRTNRALRIVLFIFATLVIWAGLGLWAEVANLSAPSEMAGLAILGGLACVALAEFLVGRFRVYRFGLEEACAFWSAVLVSGGVGMWASIEGMGVERSVFVALVTGAVLGALLYRRFGLLYCALGAGACAAAAPFFAGQSEMVSRLASAGVLVGLHVRAGAPRRRFDDDYPGDDYGVIEAASWLGLYAVINLQLTATPATAWLGLDGSTALQAVLPLAPGTLRSFYWVTYVLTWLLPVVGVYRGVRRKDHLLIRASLLMAIGTLATNKLYLGWVHHPWDPILLGFLLVATALGLRRWLSSGAGGYRGGFTSRRLLLSDLRSTADVALASVALRTPETAPSSITNPTYEPGGGRSGGAGASERF